MTPKLRRRSLLRPSKMDKIGKFKFMFNIADGGFTGIEGEAMVRELQAS